MVEVSSVLDDTSKHLPDHMAYFPEDVNLPTEYKIGIFNQHQLLFWLKYVEYHCLIKMCEIIF
jgi:hypothetical protein